jgi:hypothetical protein
VTAAGEHPPTRVGVLGSSAQALVDAHGAITPDGGRWRLDWWVGADDRWHVPVRETAVRQSLVGAAPVVETSLRVPGGDAVQRVYGIGGPGGLVAVDIENASGAPFVVALVLAPAAGGRLRGVGTSGSWVTVEGRPSLRTPRPATRWAAGLGGQTLETVVEGRAEHGVFTGARRLGLHLEVALLHPLPHRTRMRCALSAGRGDRSVQMESVDLSLLPDPEVAAAGWAAHLRRGMQALLPDHRLQQSLYAARAALLLTADAAGRASAEEVAALEDWGFDTEAASEWRRLGIRARRRAARRTLDPSPWATIQARLHAASSTFTWPDGPAPYLRAVRDLLVSPDDDRFVMLLPVFPAGWRGQDLDVRDAPTRAGLVSYAVRWHGARPALLWECDQPIRLTAPGLDRTWSTMESRGEALLAAPVDESGEPESFS